MASSPEPAQVGKQLVYTLDVLNLGPNPATGVLVIDYLPENISLISVNTSQGTYTTTGGVLKVALGSLGNAESSSISILVRPHQQGLP